MARSKSKAGTAPQSATPELPPRPPIAGPPGPVYVAAVRPRASLETAAPVSDIPVSRMDPRLQRIVSRRRAGIQKAATSSTDQNEVAVVARVTSVDDWSALTEVRRGAVVSPAKGGGSEAIVTGRIPVSRLEAVRQQPFVRSLKAPLTLRPTLQQTITEIGAASNLLPPASQASGGKGVIVGIVDFGCDFAHKNFRTAAGKTRVLAIWDQSGRSDANSPFGYGRLISRAEIDAALGRSDPYAALGYGPDPDRPGSRGSHGTHVCDIAAGNGRGTNVPGVAPEADIIFVEIASSDVPWTGPDVVGKNFGDSVQLLEAIRFIFDQAGTRPCVINVSLGTNGGPHDGSTLVEQGIDRMVREAPNRAVVIAASNSFSDGIHASGVVTAGTSVDLRWQVTPFDDTGNELEIWYPGVDRFDLEIIAPSGQSLVRLAPDENTQLSDNSGNPVLFAANRLNDPNNGDNMLNVYLEPGVPGGAWIVRLRGASVSRGTYHAWIERDDWAQSTFEPPHDNGHTIGSISCGKDTIVVGSYDAHRPGAPLSFFSSAGPTRDGREKPEISAPGHDVWAAHSRTGDRAVSKSGTSMAAPAVTGAIALLLSEALAAGRSLTIDQIRQFVRNSARRNPPGGNAWDPRYGAGRITASAMLNAVLGGAPIAAAGAAPGARGKRERQAASPRVTVRRSRAAGSRLSASKTVRTAPSSR